MWPCPHCAQGIAPPGNQEWFDCPHCGLPIRARVKKDGSPWLEPGSRPSAVRSIEYTDPSSTKPSLKLMPLEDVRRLLNEIEERQKKIRGEIQQIGVQIQQSPAMRDSTDKFTRRLSELNNEQGKLIQLGQQLLAMESFLVGERARAVQASNNAGSVAGCATIAVVAGLIVFGRVASINWDWTTIGIGVLIAAVTAISLYVVATPGNRDQ